MMESGSTTLVAVVSDTPRVPPSELLEALAGVAHIVHAGGIADLRGLDTLARIAPVSAVTSHDDFVAWGDLIPESVELIVEGVRIFATNMIGSPPDFLPPVRARLANDPPDVVLFGHPPGAQVLWLGGTLLMNPGSARAAGSHRRPTYGLLEISSMGRVTGTVLELDPVP
ncbi:MAG: metallophosphoesterase family protein [Acidobacteria bacterium]|nr:metallophosphoesterase family protein [Acidobacteriota bacterium]